MIFGHDYKSEIVDKLVRKNISIQEAIGHIGSKSELVKRLKGIGRLTLAEKVDKYKARKKKARKSKVGTKRLATSAPSYDWLPD